MSSKHFYNRLKVLENKQVFTVNINHLLEKIAVDVPILQATFGKDKSIVIKPKSTNFGLGISIFQEPTNLDSSQKALEIAFSEDSSVLGEEFIAGTEYCFFALDGKCKAVLLPQGVQIFLHRNSNISTGGDSVDVTEITHTSYKELAAEMATAMGAWVCGVDLIISDSTLPASKKESNCTCIELNFNPFMYMHTYCAEGSGQSIKPNILAKLFPEIY